MHVIGGDNVPSGHCGEKTLWCDANLQGFTNDFYCLVKIMV